MLDKSFVICYNVIKDKTRKEVNKNGKDMDKGT